MSYSVEEKYLAQNGAGDIVWERLGKQTQYEVPLTADYFTPGMCILQFDMGSLQVIWENADATDAVVSLQSSNDEINWADIETLACGLKSAQGSKMFDLTTTAVKFIRLKLESGSNTTGTMKLQYLLKSRL